ncbi:hypothetical protein IAI10_18460 [Clostridium sp. 19966]|uniref:hypothetical protein n=1 Tax=Clostridium sp. 19966 TaxID=2768166 RepID=UPI0028DE1F86|nr:hypothetical protein [Clostridium sp. 19966]MDT8718650.1 hypothetical protein [Clostridium sp. 19966]
MSCHNTGNENRSNHKHGFNKHLLHMVICCGLPIVILFMLPFIASLSPGFAEVLRKIAPFLCPLMMILMMPMMMRGNKKESCCSDDNEKEIVDIKKPIE